MKILHITPSSNGYEEVTLVANRVSKTNNLAVIKKDGELFYTGGFLINDTPEIRVMLNQIPNHLQYDFVKSFKMDPFISLKYFEDMADKVS